MSLSMLKSVPCPASDRCNAFHCLFRHPRDDPPDQAHEQLRDAVATTPTIPNTPSLPDTQDNTVHNPGNTRAKHAAVLRGLDDSDVPRKRLKIDDTTAAASSASSSPSTLESMLHQKQPVKTAGLSTYIGNGVSKGSGLATRPGTPTPTSHLQPATGTTTRSPIPPHTLSNPTTPSPELAHKSLVPITTDNAKPTKPEVLNPRAVKSVPAKHEIRLKLLRMLHQEFVRLNDELKQEAKIKPDAKQLVILEQGLITRALDEEQRLAAEKGQLYTSAMKHRVMHYKRMKLPQWKQERIDALKKKRKPTPENEQPSGSGRPVVIDTGLTAVQEVCFVRERLLTPVTEHAQHGYVTTPPTPNDVEKARQGAEASGGWEKCDRCEKRFQVFPGRREEDGALASGGNCKHHSGKAFFPGRAAGDNGPRPGKKWRCCATTVGETIGCTESSHHVFKVSDPKRLSLALPFAKTPENDAVPGDRAVAFDCEMAYTVFGLELIRITATAWPTGEALLDVLVRPFGEILDLNSAFSGVWPHHMANAELWTSCEVPPPLPAGPESKMRIVPSPAAARTLFFSLISPSTPLIGHGLENDLNAVRMIHPTLVDTVLLYPHSAGLPMRNGLRALMERHLNRVIQSNTGNGHDSAEDARAAGDLVRLRVSQDWVVLKIRGWSFDSDGKLVEPGTKKPGKKGALTEQFIENSVDAGA